MNHWLQPALAAAVVAVLLVPGGARGAEAADPSLVLLVSVDQLRRDRLDPELPGGLGRLAREGRVYVDAALAHAITATCAGHVTMLSGRHPGPAGVPANSFIDRETGEEIYCVEDAAEDARVLGGRAGRGRSPRLLRVTMLGDWMKQAQPETRVFSVSGKDRAAITLAGQHPDTAYWLLAQVGFTTSRYYRDALPDWVAAFNDGLLERVPEQWEHSSAPLDSGREDDYRGESSEHSRTSPHPIRDDDPARAAENLWVTPFVDELTLAFATELVRRERLGRGATPDLLALSLSATDPVGHSYGPESHEARDALLRLDAALGHFLDFLDAELGSDRVLVALTADHGVLPLPEWLIETGRSTCPVKGGRSHLRRLGWRLAWHLYRKFSPLLSMPGEWVQLAGGGITVNRALAKKHGVEVADVVAAAKQYLEARDAIARVWTHEEILAGEDELAALYRHSLDPERSGDLLPQVEPTCYVGVHGDGTGHGSPYLYDRAVPIVFHGPGVEPGKVGGPAATVDIAPTLAGLLGVPTPPDLDGRALFP